mgnify:CR=1 FL=1
MRDVVGVDVIFNVGVVLVMVQQDGIEFVVVLTLRGFCKSCMARDLGKYFLRETAPKL